MSKKMIASTRAYQKVFNSEEGQLVLKDLMKRNFVKDSTFDGDSLGMAYREGARSVVLFIFNQLKTDITQLEQFLRERERHEESL